MRINRKTALILATVVWYIGQYAELRRVASWCDAALGFNFMHFFMSISEWIEWW